MKILRYQLKLALVSNVYQTYLFFENLPALVQMVSAHPIAGVWFYTLSAMHVVILLPKIVLLLVL